MATKGRAMSMSGRDPQRSAAMKGNTNASRGGATAAALGTLLPFGSVIGGAALGAMGKNQTALTRHTAYSTGFGALGGGIVGTGIAGPLGTIPGVAVGAAGSYIGSKIGQKAGKMIRGKR
jgi:hypothetical protein